MENLMTVVDRIDELQASSVGRRECSRTRQRTGARHMDVHVDTYSQPWSRATGCGHCPGTCALMEVSQGSGVCAALCIRLTLRWHVTISTPMVIGDCCYFDCLLTVFECFLTNGTLTLHQSSKTLKTIGVPIVTGLPRLYQQCTNRQKQSKHSQNSPKMTISVPVVTCLPRLY